MICARSTSRPARPAFSLIELVVVVVIIGIIAAIAVPRLSSAAVRSRVTALRGNLATLNRAAELYTAEHSGRGPERDTAGALSLDGDALVTRMVGATTETGAGGGMFGPYVLRMPANPFSQLATVRVDGAPAGAGTHGWRFNSVTKSFQADDSLAMAAIGAHSVGAAALAASDLSSGKVVDAEALKDLDGVK